MNRVGMVVNPVGDPAGADELIDVLKREHDLRVVETTEDDPGRSMAQELLDDGCSVIVACGGDGTVRASAEALVGSEAELVVMPAGTGNLLALNLGLPDAVSDVAALVDAGRSVRIDAGVANGETFLIMAGTGLDTTIMEKTERRLKDRLGPLAYVMTALSHLGDDPVDVSLSVDGAAPEALSVATVLVGNMGRIFGPLDVFPDADSSDGRFDVLAVTAESLAAWVAAAKETLGEPGERARRFTAEAVVVEFDRPRTYQLDGEERPQADAIDIRIERAALNVRRPR